MNRQAVLFEENCKKGYQTKAVKFETFCEEWFEEYTLPNLRNSTYERMLQLRGRVYDAIGHLRMDKITARQIQAFISSLSKEGANEKTGKPLASKTIRHYLSLISDVFSYGVKMGIYTDTTKTRRSQRTMKFPQEIMDLLKQLREEQGEQALKMGDYWTACLAKTMEKHNTRTLHTNG